MLKSDLVQADKHSANNMAKAEKSPIFTSHITQFKTVGNNST